MKTKHWKYRVELRKQDGQPLGLHACEPDIEPACESIRLDALRDGECGDVPSSSFQLDPSWDGSRGAPYLAGIRVAHAGRECVASTRSCFEDAARAIRATLQDLGQVGANEEVDYEVQALPDEPPRRSACADFQIEELPSMPPICAADVATMFERSTPVGDVANSHLPLFIPRRVIDELHFRSVAANGIETGSILLGRLCRDRATRALAAVITAQIPAEATESDATRLKFTSATWGAGMAAAIARGSCELMLGTSHSHPARAWCAKCPEERQRVCKLAQPFLSPEDRILHRTVFARGWCVSLVVVDAADGVRHGLFGWHRGELVGRGYHRLDHAADESLPDFFDSTEPSHATSQPES